MNIPPLIQTLVQVVGCIVLVLAAVFCVACGLYCAAEWLEDHVKTSFRLIKRGTIWCLAFQLAWITIDRSALIPNLVGVASHLNSWLLLKHHPHHQINMPLTAAAVLLLVAHQTTWIIWWLQRNGSIWQVSSVLAGLVWPVPTMLLLSSASSDSSLPVSLNPPPAGLRSQGSYSASPQRSPTATAAAAAAGKLIKRPAADSASGAHWPHKRPLLPDTSRQGSDQQPNGFMGLLPHNSTAVLGSPRAALHPTEGGVQGLGGKKQHRSRVVQGLDTLQYLLKKHGASLLPVTDTDAESAAAARGLMAKLYRE